jgi:NAD(P)H dehydrogenase (quinone)
LPEHVDNAMVGIKQAMAAGAFDIVTGGVERLSGRCPRPPSDVLSKRFAA